MIVKDVLQKIYGVSTYENVNPLVTSVGTTITQIASANPGRLSIYIQNLGSYSLYISRDNQTSSSHGILLSPNGGDASYNFRDDLESQTREFYAISVGGSNDIYIEENIIAPNA